MGLACGRKVVLRQESLTIQTRWLVCQTVARRRIDVGDVDPTSSHRLARYSCSRRRGEMRIWHSSGCTASSCCMLYHHWEKLAGPCWYFTYDFNIKLTRRDCSRCARISLSTDSSHLWIPAQILELSFWLCSTRQMENSKFWKNWKFIHTCSSIYLANWNCSPLIIRRVCGEVFNVVNTSSSSSSKSLLYVTFRHKRSFKWHYNTIKTL